MGYSFNRIIHEIIYIVSLYGKKRFKSRKSMRVKRGERWEKKRRGDKGREVSSVEDN